MDGQILLSNFAIVTPIATKSNKISRLDVKMKWESSIEKWESRKESFTVHLESGDST